MTAIPEPNQSTGGGGLLRIKSNSQLMEEEKKEQENQNELPIINLASYVRQAWMAAYTAKRSDIEEEMLEALRARRSEYNPSKYRQIKEQGGSEVYMGLTDVKCTDAEAWIKDVLLPSDDRAWGINPTPAPDLPQVMQEAIENHVQMEVDSRPEQVPEAVISERMSQLKDAIIDRFDELAREVSERMERAIDDQFVEGGFYEALDEVIYDVTTFPAGIIRRGMKITQSLSWSSDGVTTKPVTEKKAINHWYRVSPFDIYPAPDSSGVDDGYLIEKHRMRRSDLSALKGVTGFKNEAIDLVLAAFGVSGWRHWVSADQQRSDLENKDDWRNTPDSPIDAIEFHGEIQGQLLLEWGMSEEVIKDPLGEYEANVWVIGPYVIKAVLNKDPLLRRPYFKASYQDIPGAFWGRGVAKKMQDTQAVCNGVARSIMNNVAISSGPQVEIHTDRMAANEDLTSMYPWKIWQTKPDPTGGGHRALQFDQPKLNAGELQQVYEFFSRLADDHTGIPPFGSGAQTQQSAGSRAAAGIAMLLTTAAKGIKQVVKNIDKGIIEPAVERNYQWNMQFNPDESIKGDVEIEAKGARSLVTKEQLQVRRQEFLQSTANPYDFQLMGAEGRTELLKEVSKGLDMPGKKIVPNVIQLPPPQGQGQQQGAPAETNAAGDKPADTNTVPNRA